jgi:hypothetical protein
LSEWQNAYNLFYKSGINLRDKLTCGITALCAAFVFDFCIVRSGAFCVSKNAFEAGKTR